MAKLKIKNSVIKISWCVLTGLWFLFSLLSASIDPDETILNKTSILITNSGLTKYEGVYHHIPVVIFSDTKESQKIDKVFIKKTKQIHFSYLKRGHNDIFKFKKIMNTKIKPIVFNKNKSYMNKIKFFFNN